MKKDFSHQVLSIDGEPIPLPKVEGKAQEYFTTKTAAVNALMGQPDKENPSGEEKVRRYKLAVKIHSATEPVDVTAEEISLLKKLIGESYPVAIVGPVFAFLET